MRAAVMSSTPKPCTPSTQNSTRRSGERRALTVFTTSEMARTGVFTPVPECTQVSATTRVVGVMACSMACGREHLVTAPERQPCVQDGEPHRGAVREGDFVGRDAHVRRRWLQAWPRANAALLEIQSRVVIQRPAMALDRLAHAPGM